MEWLEQLLAELSEFYPSSGQQDIIGYLKGGRGPKEWHRVIRDKGRPQMLILGSAPPSDADWLDAGVLERNLPVIVVRRADLQSFVILYGGFKARPWGRLEQVIGYNPSEYHRQIARFRANRPVRSVQSGMSVRTELAALVDLLDRQADLMSGEHGLQADLLNGYKSNSHFIAFCGYWTNHLFNTDIPPTDIWAPVYSNIGYARRMVANGSLREAVKATFNARRSFVIASGIFRKWKDGIEIAGTKMQATIAVVAVAAILAAAAATAAAAAAGTAAASTGAASTSGAATAEAALVRVAALVEQGDAIVYRIATGATESASAATSIWEAGLIEAETATEEIGRLVAGGGG